MKFTVTALLCLICTAALLSTTEGSPIRILRCKCITLFSGPPIPRSRIVSFKVILPGPHCKNEQIIITMKKGETCLDPNQDWVKALKKILKTMTPSPKTH